MEINPNFSANAKKDFMLVLRAKDGDQKAYTALMQRYTDSLYFLALKIVNNKDDAMDLTVETFAKAFENIEKYKPDFAFSTWIFKIATNNCIDFVRKKRLKVVSLQSLTEENKDERQFYMISNTLNPEETSIKKEESENLKNILEHLPQRYQTLIILKYYDEKSYEEISQQLDLPLGTVKAQLSRARELMSNIMNLKKNLRSDF